MILLYSAILLVASAWLPWWVLILFSITAGYLSDRRLFTLTQVSFSVFVCWLSVSYFLDYGMRGKVAIRLAQAIAELGYSVPSILIYVAIAFIGGLISLIFALLGYDLKEFRLRRSSEV